MQPSRRRLGYLIQFALKAVSAKPAHPAQIDLDRQFGQAAPSPIVNSCTFASIAGSCSHAFLDDALMEPFEKLSGAKYYRTRKLQGFAVFPLDNGGLQIMRLILSAA